MTKTVGILTFHNGYNFGAVLQAFALQRTIASFGNSCKIIDYRRPGLYPLFCFPANFGDIKFNIRALLNFKSLIVLRKRFANFLATSLRMTSTRYKSFEELAHNNLRFDVYVTGSDQVWNPHMLEQSSGIGPIYYLEFITSGRRVAYAPSFGVSDMPGRYRDLAAEYLKRFDFLSSREETGCSIIRELTGRNAEHVLDPTLLQPANAYNQIAVEPFFGKPYILLYPMQPSDALNHLAINVSKYLNLPIVAVLPTHYNPMRFSFADKVVFDAGPAEFLGWIKNASFVCTNSFHGTCFSIIYRKCFLGVAPAIGNTRLQSLLTCMGLLSRQLSDQYQLAEGDPLLEPIDYAPIELRLQMAINNSLNYLKQAVA